MSVEDRLRRGLAAEAAQLTPQVEQRLEAVLRRRQRSVRWRRLGTALAVAAALLTAVMVVVSLPRTVPTVPAPAHTGAVSTGPAQALVGEYLVNVTDNPASETAGMVGRWLIELRPDGAMLITPPKAFNGAASGSLYAVTDDILSTDAFIDQPGCQVDSSPGRYRFDAGPNQVTFTVEDDSCPARLTVLGGQPWERVR